MSEQIIQLLVAEKNRLDRVIQILQGSSPKVVDVYDDPTMPDWVKPKAKVIATPETAPKKRKMSAAGRRAIREGVRKRWAAVKAAKAGTVAPKASKKSAILAAVTPSAEDVEFKSKMSIAMKKAWAKRKRAAKKKTTKAV